MKKIHISAHNFYMNVYAYISMEYKPKYTRIYADSNMSETIVDLVSQYYYGGNSVQFTAGQIVDLIRNKYRK